MAYNLVSPEVFVDDNDPAIFYTGPWLPFVGLPTDFTTLTTMNLTSTPQYGTLHTPQNLLLNSSGFWYMFNGSDFDHGFKGGIGIITSCKVDNIDQIVEQLTEGTACFNGDKLSHTEHNLSVTFKASIPAPVPSISFDGITITPWTLPSSGVDIMYRTQTTNFFNKIGEELTWNFDGTSVGMYCSILIGDTAESASFSYALDNGGPVNFTILNPPHVLSITIKHQLIIQTPSMPRGPHSLKVTFLGPENSLQVMPLNAIVQSTTRVVNLDVVPRITNSTMTSPTAMTVFGSTPTSAIITNTTRKAYHIGNNIIAAISVSTLIILVACSWLWRRHIRMRRCAVEAYDRTSMAVSPFSGPDPEQQGRFMLAQYTTTEKTSKYRRAFGIGVETTYRDPAQVQLEEGDINVEEIQHPEPPPRIRFRFHEDGGEVVDGGENNEEEDTISLPPIYSTIVGSRRPDSSRAASRTSHDITGSDIPC